MFIGFATVQIPAIAFKDHETLKKVSTQTMHEKRGNPSELPSLCINFDLFQSWGKFMQIPVQPL